MTAVLIRNLEGVLTGRAGDAARLDAPDLRLEDGCITAVGRLEPQPGDTLVDGSGCVAYPAWVNTHHHLFQSLLKAEPQGLNQTLTPWLASTPYRFRASFDAQRFRLAVRIGLVELALSGCGTVADHNYLYFPGQDFDPSAILFEEAQALGLRMVLCRGGATLTRGLEAELPTALRPERVEDYLRDVERLVGVYHQPDEQAMRRVVMAPTTPTFSMTPQEMRTCAQVARRLGIRLHSHLSETVSYAEATRARHAMRPVEFAQTLGWLGPDVWFAHLVKLDDAEIRLLGETGTGIAHCPQSNGRLASGIAPVLELEAAGCPVSLAVDGAASNEAADMISESHAAWLASRAREGERLAPRYDGGSGEAAARVVSAERVVHWGTQGGARVLGLPAIGEIAPGKAADIALYDLGRDARYFGVHDPLVAPVVCGGRAHLRRLYVNGREVVRDGHPLGVDLLELGLQARESLRAMGALKSGG